MRDEIKKKTEKSGVRLRRVGAYDRKLMHGKLDNETQMGS